MSMNIMQYYEMIKGEMMTTYTFENDAILFLDESRGCNIPMDFANGIRRDCVAGVTADVWACLEQGDTQENEWYWEAWCELERDAVATDPDTKIDYFVYHNGDCWLVPVGCDIP